ncbi:MAG: PSD1 domain-containing protein [Acidobacteria bacterium]|nr:PSD1 domain-containing protein [Acidobacteriota bacterium]
MPILNRLLLFGLGIVAMRGAEFDRDVRPLLMAKCMRCHGGDRTAAGFDMTTAQSFAKSGVVVKGDPAASKLFQFVSSGKMPMGGPRLSEEEVGLLGDWIRGGAAWGADLAAAKKKTWWAFVPPSKPKVPKIDGVLNPIDAFLLAKLQTKGLAFSPRANDRDLTRRLHFGLTGLPPSDADYTRSYAENVEKLLASPAYGERWARYWLDVVRFGETDGGEHNFERFHAWRYRDYVIDAFNSDKPYTQFVREQITGDLLAPKDPQMVAATGFLVAGPWDSVSAELNKDALMKKTARMDELDDMVTTTFHSFQALTVNCARCHDHKFDPIPTRDYYSLTAVFGGVGFGTREVATDAAKAAYESAAKPLQAEIARVQKELDAIELPVRTRLMRERYQALDEKRRDEKYRVPLSPFFNRNTFAPVTAKHFRLVISGQSGKLPKIDELELRPAGLRVASFIGAANATAAAPVIVSIPSSAPATVSEMVWSTDRVTGKGDGTIRVYSLEASDDGANWRAIAGSLDHVSANELELPSVSDKDLIAALPAAGRQRRVDLLAERDEWKKKLEAVPPLAMVYAAKPHPVEPAYLLERGSVAKAKEEVFPGALSALAHRSASFGFDASAPDDKRRNALADWIADSKNPLTARVIVNRVWYYHFGNGIVNTPSDFGQMGDRPSHPELLDWLAVSFMENGWSLKWLQRQIVSSQAYQQSSALNEKAFGLDADNRLLWRMPLHRMDAETLRDSILAATGSLNSERGGPGFLLQKKGGGGSYIYDVLDNDGPPVWRRAVYRFVVRGGGRIFMDSFDCPDPSVATPQRSNSNTPVQALTLLNNTFVLKQSERMAERLTNEAGAGAAAQVARAYSLLFGRAPSEKELRAGVSFIASHSLAAYARVLFNTNEFLYTP